MKKITMALLALAIPCAVNAATLMDALATKDAELMCDFGTTNVGYNISPSGEGKYNFAFISGQTAYVEKTATINSKQNICEICRDLTKQLSTVQTFENLANKTLASFKIVGGDRIDEVDLYSATC